MHRWTPVSSTVPWSTSTSQEVFGMLANKQRVSNLSFRQQKRAAVLWLQLALLSLSQSRTLLVFLFGTPHHGPVQALFQQMPTERVKW